MEPTEPTLEEDFDHRRRKDLAEAHRLRNLETKPDEPYRHRYDERNILKQLANMATALGHLKDAAHANALLGTNYMDTEEIGEARPLLEAALDALEEQDHLPAVRVDVLNRLGVLSADREEHDLALRLLQRACAIYESSGADTGEGADGAALGIEQLHTLTCFYLAQAFGNLGKPADSAGWCARTLERQLLEREAADVRFDSREWAKNAAQLARYYANEGQISGAEHCLLAAEAVLTQARAARATA